MQIELDIKGLGKYTLTLKRGSYGGKMLALRLEDFEDGAPFSTLTVNIVDSNHLLAPGEFFIKTWSENEHVVNALRERTDIFLDTGRRVTVSHQAIAEIWQFANDRVIDDITLL